MIFWSDYWSECKLLVKYLLFRLESASWLKRFPGLSGGFLRMKLILFHFYFAYQVDSALRIGTGSATGINFKVSNYVLSCLPPLYTCLLFNVRQLNRCDPRIERNQTAINPEDGLCSFIHCFSKYPGFLKVWTNVFILVPLLMNLERIFQITTGKIWGSIAHITKNMWNSSKLAWGFWFVYR